MMDFLYGVIVGVLAAGWWTIIPLFVVALWFEHADSRTMTFLALTIVLATVAYMFSLGWKEVGIAALVYIPIGFVWSFFRWRKHVREVVADTKKRLADNNGEQYKDYKDYNESIKRDAARAIDVSRNTGLITWLILNWPVSFLSSFTGDLFEFLNALVKKAARVTYARWSATAQSEIDKL